MKSIFPHNISPFVFSVVISIIFINLLSLKYFERIDLTRDKKYTLSVASRETVKKLPDVVTITGYFSEGLPPPYASYIRYVLQNK